MQEYTDEQGVTHRFPDDATPEEISKAVGVPLSDGSVDYDLGKSYDNLPESAYQYGSDVWSGLGALSPLGYRKEKDGIGFTAPTGEQEGFGLRRIPLVETLKKLASGGAQMMAGEKGTYANPENVALVQGVGAYYKDRYGGWGNIKQTAMDDPVGLLSDLSIPVTLGGTAGIKAAQLAEKTGKFAKTVAAAEKMAKVIKTTGEVIDPIGAATKVARPLYNVGAKHVLSSEVENLSDINRISRRLYDENVPMNERGLEMLDDITTSDMAARDAILAAIRGEFDLNKPFIDMMSPFMDDISDAASTTRGPVRVGEARDAVGRVIAGELTDLVLDGGNTRNAMGLNRVKTRQMTNANAAGAYKYTGEDFKVPLRGKTYRQAGSNIKNMLEEAAGPQGPELARLNAAYGDNAGASRALGHRLGVERPSFDIDYPIRSGATAMGVPSHAAVTLGALASNYGGRKATEIALMLKDTGFRQFARESLLQAGRTEKEVEGMLAEAEKQSQFPLSLGSGNVAQ